MCQGANHYVVWHQLQWVDLHFIDIVRISTSMLWYWLEKILLESKDGMPSPLLQVHHMGCTWSGCNRGNFASFSWALFLAAYSYLISDLMLIILMVSRPLQLRYSKFLSKLWASFISQLSKYYFPLQIIFMLSVKIGYFRDRDQRGNFAPSKE